MLSEGGGASAAPTRSRRAHQRNGTRIPVAEASVTRPPGKMVYGGRCRYGEEHGTRHVGNRDHGSRERRRRSQPPQGSAGRGGSARTGRAAEKAGPDGTVADVDP